MTKLKFLNPNTKKIIPFASIHANGRLVFNKDAENYMKLQKNQLWVVATQDSEKESPNFYLIDNSISESPDITDPVMIRDSGRNFFIKFKSILDQLKIVKGKRRVQFDIKRVNLSGYEKYQIFHFTLRQKNID